MHCAFILYSSYQELRKLQPHRNEEIEKVDNFSSVTWHTLNKVNRALDLLKIKKKTRLTYNCAHLRLTKESLTIEYFEKAILLDFLGENFFGGENFLG